MLPSFFVVVGIINVVGDVVVEMVRWVVGDVGVRCVVAAAPADVDVPFQTGRPPILTEEGVVGFEFSAANASVLEWVRFSDSRRMASPALKFWNNGAAEGEYDDGKAESMVSAEIGTGFRVSAFISFSCSCFDLGSSSCVGSRECEVVRELM